MLQKYCSFSLPLHSCRHIRWGNIYSHSSLSGRYAFNAALDSLFSHWVDVNTFPRVFRSDDRTVFVHDFFNKRRTRCRRDVCAAEANLTTGYPEPFFRNDYLVKSSLAARRKKPLCCRQTSSGLLTCLPDCLSRV